MGPLKKSQSQPLLDVEEMLVDLHTGAYKNVDENLIVTITSI